MEDVTRVAWALALATIVGGSTALMFIVAPLLFRSLPSRAQAGTIFGRMLTVFGGVEVTAAIVLMFAAVFWLYERPGTGSTIRGTLAAVLLVASMLHHLWVVPVARRLREDIDADDAARARFRKLHRLSSVLAMLTLALGAALIVYSALAPN